MAMPGKWPARSWQSGAKGLRMAKKAGVGRLETVLVVLGRFAMVMDGIGAQVRGRVIWDRLVLRTRLM